MQAKKGSGGGAAATKGGARSVKNKNIKSIDAKIAKAKAKYYDLLDLKAACKALERLEKNGYKTVPAKEVFAKWGIEWNHD